MCFALDVCLEASSHRGRILSLLVFFIFGSLHGFETSNDNLEAIPREQGAAAKDKMLPAELQATPLTFSKDPVYLSWLRFSKAVRLLRQKDGWLMGTDIPANQIGFLMHELSFNNNISRPPHHCYQLQPVSCFLGEPFPFSEKSHFSEQLSINIGTHGQIQLNFLQPW